MPFSHYFRIIKLYSHLAWSITPDNLTFDNHLNLFYPKPFLGKVEFHHHLDLLAQGDLCAGVDKNASSAEIVYY